MSNPLTPNFKPGVGRLATDRYDFESHIEGTNFRHKANQIDLFPTLVIGSNTPTNVQDALAELAALIVPPVIPDATVSNLGIVQLAGDIGGTAASVKVIGLQQRPISAAAPTTNQVLTWNGSVWAPQAIPASFIASGDLSGSSTSQQVIGLTGSGGGATVAAHCNAIAFDATSFPEIYQVAPSSGSGGPFFMAAQGGATGGNGGSFNLFSGLGGTGSTLDGAIQLTTGLTNMIDATHLATGPDRRVLAFLAPSGITSFHMPSGTGNMVMYIADTATPPSTGSPVNGSILYSSGGGLYIKQSNSQQFQITPNILPTVTTSSNYPMGVSDVVVLVNTGSPVTVTLPVPASGRRVVVKDSTGNAATNNITVARNGSENIEGLGSNKLIAANWGSLTLISDGTNWFII